MTVTKIKALTKTRFQVYLDEEAAFVLYKGELRRYHLEEGEELSEETYREMDRTEYQLRSKLLMGGYPEDITDQAIEYVKSFGYLNDLEYARRFVESRKHAKSRRQLYALLSGKGLDSSLIEQVLEEGCRSEDAREAIRAILRKKRFDRETASEKERQRMYASLARKGFRYEDVGKVMSE